MTEWRKSSYSGGMNDDACVEVARLVEGVAVRDSKNPDGDRLNISRTEFAELVQRVKRGELDL
ncbi:hypothetical protein Acsp04_27580 [Actinomadura sp. NBRC 104425]|uniref:DUF397 domain-containing protein n=1 Tax=Actinomadura sp. NBRC 104425 TaxID=3032204 RepID=UPI0024A0A848|nr:DUF397 domain-containing protein [Actinomadura sp. NBRC 104425]GLZ12523.1 hypothetical protein Acsp04_27580 [Actinomadura sp. NBRC 104425]